MAMLQGIVSEGIKAVESTPLGAFAKDVAAGFLNEYAHQDIPTTNPVAMAIGDAARILEGATGQVN